MAAATTGAEETYGRESELARAALRIAASRTMQDLGDAYALGVRHLIGSRSVGLYALANRRPNLLVARDAAMGFLDAYAERSQNGDLLVERVLERGCAIDGATELGDRLWLTSGSFTLLDRWGYAHCMCGPLLADVVETSNLAVIRLPPLPPGLAGAILQTLPVQLLVAELMETAGLTECVFRYRQSGTKLPEPPAS
jgi:hypothetical protein